MAEPPRPSRVPAEATWSEQDQEWVLGPRDAEGRFHGLVRYWRRDGTLCCACEHVAGKPHGRSTRYHESGELSVTCTFVEGRLHGTSVWHASDQPTTERMHDNGLSRRVRRSEFDHEHGVLLTMRYFDADGKPLCRDGTPLPPRPANVDPLATFQGVWVSGRWTEDGKRNGLLRYHSREGVLIEETEWRDNLGEGRHRAYDATGELREECTFHAGLREGLARLYRVDGTLAREATFSRGEYHGALRDYDASGTRVVREVPFTQGERQAPPAPAALPPAPAPAAPVDWRQRLEDKSPLNLDLSYVGLERVPDEVRTFRGLRWLALDHNRLRRLPAWLVELEELTGLRLARNRLPLPRTGRAVLTFLRRTQALPLIDRRVRFCLFMGDVEQARAEGDVAALARALGDKDGSVRAYAEVALAGARPSPFAAGQRVYLAGLPRQRSRAVLRQELQAAGLTCVEHPEQAQVLLLLDRPGALVSDPRPLAVEADLAAPAADPRALARLYATAQAHPELAERHRAQRQFQREASAALWAFTQGYAPGLGIWDERRLAPRLRTLGRTGLIDLQELAETLFQHTGRGVPLLMGAGGQSARKVLASLIKDRTLNLELKGLQHLPAEIGDFPNLAFLKLGYNQLTTVPEEIGDLFSLVELSLHLNALRSLPDGVARLVQLRRLDLHRATFERFPEPLAALTRLTHLNLGGGGWKQLPEALCRFTRLEELDLDYNGLTTLPESFAELRQLTNLRMAANPLEAVPPVVFELRGLKTLWLEGCRLHTLPADIARLQELELLCIWYNPSLASVPIDALAELPRLKELRIRGHRLPRGQEEKLRAALPRCTIY